MWRVRVLWWPRGCRPRRTRVDFFWWRVNATSNCEALFLLTKHITLSVDAMGGDSAPDIVIAGLDIARRNVSDIGFIIFGDRKRVAPLLEKFPETAKISKLVHTSEVVLNDDKPVDVLRRRKKSSMRLAIDAVKDGKADGVVSAGNTGALMVAAVFSLKTLPGVSRPAIATMLPSRSSDVVMLDLGANAECDAENLVQFAVMGEVYARAVLGHLQPSVAILNIGEEDMKGHHEVKKAFQILQNNTALPIKFYGFVEGDDIGAGTVDVIVTDGFTGNIALKTIEGTSKTFTHFLKNSISGSLLAKVGALFMIPAFEAFRERVDPRRYNGAMFLGLNGVCVKSHGGTDNIGFAAAVEVAVNMIRQDYNDRIRGDLERLMSDSGKEAMKVAAR